jgi:DNA-binding NarL/FixJ family response regulator
MINIVVVESDDQYRAVLEMTIKQQPDWQCLLSSISAEHFRAAIPTRSRIDFAFLDIELSGESGIDLIPFLHAHSPASEIIMLTNLSDRNTLLQCLLKGATGYLLKDVPLSELPQLVKIVMDGGAALSPFMAKYLIRYFSPPKRQAHEKNILTPKEEQVLKLLDLESSYEDIATMLRITKDGVRFHVRNIYGKLNVNRRIDAIRKWKAV